MNNTELRYGNIWLLPVRLQAGKAKGKHSHEFDHIHQVVYGEATLAIFTMTGKVLKRVHIKKGDILKVPKRYPHQIEALTDYLGNCIHAFRTTKGDVVESTFSIDEDLFLFPQADIQETK